VLHLPDMTFDLYDPTIPAGERITSPLVKTTFDPS
jgi:hypothetical protein